MNQVCEKIVLKNGLSEKKLRIYFKNCVHTIEVSKIMKGIEKASPAVQDEIKIMFEKIESYKERYNTDLKEYLRFLGLCMLKNQYGEDSPINIRFE